MNENHFQNGAPQEHPADMADRLQGMTPEEAARQLRALPTERAAAALAEMDSTAAHRIADELSSADLHPMLDAMPHNKAADILGELPEERQREALARLAPENSSGVQRLLSYPENSAGSLMSDAFYALREDWTLEYALESLRRDDDAQRLSASYLYVVDSQNRLAGVVTLRDLILRRRDLTVSAIAQPTVQRVRASDDQETVARLFSQYRFLSLPVVEADGRLVGVVSADQAIRVEQAEATEDMQLMVGLSGEERTYTPWAQSFSRRLPWLMVNLGTAFLAAAVVGIFEDTIAQWTALAVFLPIVAGQGGNAGAQTLTVMIRGMAMGEVNDAAGRRALLKEITLGVLNGLALGLVVGVVGYWWKGNAMLGVVVCVAMFLNMLAAAFSGVTIPLLLRSLHIDPALASSIFLTTVTDVAGFFFFLGLAALALRFQ
ncbi:MAG: magnesium transporter [Kiritimatiellae bacterium]|nr:magnesium transporter [Kiritimatiellia bacterium]